MKAAITSRKSPGSPQEVPRKSPGIPSACLPVDRVQKPERSGTTIRFRALVNGGKGYSTASFGIDKVLSPNKIIVKTCRYCKRNIFYVNRYLNPCLSYNLDRKHNSCRVHLRAVSPDFGLHGHPLIVEKLKYVGVFD